MQKAGGAYLEIRGEDKRLQGDLDKAHGKVSSSATKMQNMVTKAFKIMSVAAVAGIAAITAAITKSVLSFAPFEVALNRLGNVSDKTIKSMRKEILGLSSRLGSVTNLTKGYYQVMSAGITETDKSMKMLKVSAKMSLEATIQQAEAVKGLAATIGAYSDELKTATDAADLLYSIEKSGITSVGELIPLIGNLANLSKAVGLSANEMAAGIAQITTSGAGTSIAVTHMQSLLVALSKQFTKLPPKIQAYGTAIEAVKTLGFQGVLKEIMDYTEGNSTVLGKMLGRQEGYLALLQLSKNEFKDYGERLGGMTDKTGAFDDAWKRYSKTLTAIWDTFKNTVGRQAVLLGEKLAPKIKEVAERMTTWIEKNDELIAQKVPVYVDALIAGLTTAASWAEKTAKFIIDIKDAMRIIYLFQTGQAGRLLFPEKPEGKGPIYFPEEYSITYPSRKPEEALGENRVAQVYKQTEEMKARYAEYYAALAEMEENADIEAIMRERERLEELEPFIAARHEIWLSAYEAEEARLDEYASYRTGQEKSITEQIRAIRMTDKTFALDALKEKYENYKNFTDDLIGLELWRAAKEKEIQESGYDDMTNAMMGWANNFSSTLNDMLWGAEVTFASILESFMKMITQMLIQIAIMGPLTAGITGLFSGLFSAQGNVFSQSGLHNFAQGGIVNKPTQFAFAGGAGLMGEAGPEAIMPLARTHRGDLGVKAVGEPSDRPQKQTINVIMNNPTFQDLETQRQVMAQIAGTVAAQIAPGAIVENYQNDGEIRQMVRGGM